MATTSADSLLDALRQHRLLDFKQWEELNTFRANFPDPISLAKELIQRGWLTPYQANQLLKGKGHELVLGSYLLLERLGEGGMGQVFKARHRNLNRISATKLIRKERLDNPNAVRRFQREVRSAAALSHPNIVHAYDADEIAGTHLMVMEYIEGAIDLANLVKIHGPLPVERACEYIRQAALGLQHAYERGMVHRDIKPANLLLTAGGKVVKVLDMGLARLDEASMDDDKSSTMTQEGSIMGTPDYIAPEQAMDSHSVDIRADLYSLGCTLYYLLTGRVPFPGGSLMEKLMKHRLDDPLPVEKLRPEVTAEVATVVRKMMAKKPEDRYQTPAEVAAVLAAAGHSLSGVAVTAVANDLTITQGEQKEVVKEVRSDTLLSAFAYIGKRDDTVPLEPQQSVRKKPKLHRWLLVSLGTIFFVLVGLGVILLLIPNSPAEKKPAENGEEHATPPQKTPSKVDDAWLKTVAAMPAEKQVEAVAAKLTELNPGFDGNLTPQIEGGMVTGLQFVTDKVTDTSPLRAWAGLRSLRCSGSNPNAQLADLSPLKGMSLTSLWCEKTQVADLSPLKDMNLTFLDCSRTQVPNLSPLKDMRLRDLRCGWTQVSDLAPLKGMELTYLYCEYTKVSNLSPLKGMKLRELGCIGTPVSDLSPLQGMPCFNLYCHNTQVTDLSPLKGMPLKEISCDFNYQRDAELLRSIRTLEKINELPAAEFWKDVEAKQAAFETWCKQVAAMPAEKQVEAVAKKLQELNPGFDGKTTHKKEGEVVTELRFVTDKVKDISPLRTLSGLTTLHCTGSHWWGKGELADLSPLRGMHLLNLYCEATKVADLAPLQGMKLKNLNCSYTPVSNLSPLKDMDLTSLWCQGTKVTDLAPLKDMKMSYLTISVTLVSNLAPLKDMKLIGLRCDATQVTDLSPLKAMPLQELRADLWLLRNAVFLRSIMTLQSINGKSPQDFWKELDVEKKLEKKK